MAKRRASRKPAAASKKRRRKPIPPTLPVVPEQKVLEARSGAIFVETVSPWPVTPWTHHDYGMDAMMDVVRPRDDGGRGVFNTGRRVGVQLKARDGKITGEHIRVRVQVRTLRYWLGSHEPFMLVFCQVPARRLSYRWIDDDLIAELTGRDPTWFTQESVTVAVPVSQVLSAARLDDVDRESRRVVRRRHRVLAPGTYHRLLTEARSTMDALSRAAEAAGLASVVGQLAEAAAKVRNATYVVALAGRMRAGKSTLFNALVRREVSPVARRPTTAVAILVTAGDSDSATVAFLDGRRLAIAATADDLAEYATQERNRENHKGVRAVTVRLVSERLERGIAILDAPGLFDPSEQIRDITARALATAHAVLFVMDVSSARTGGFGVESHVLEELHRAVAHSERVFLLLNKNDELDDADRQDVMATLSHALDGADLANRLAAPPVFISAKRAWAWVAENATTESPIAELEGQIWDYLLETNSTGVERLETAVRECARAVDDAVRLTELRRASSEQARSVQARLAAARKDTTALQANCRAAAKRARAMTDALLGQELAALPQAMGDEMREAGVLPSKAVVTKRLVARVEVVLGQVWQVTLRTLENDAREVSERLQVALSQVRLDHESPAQPTIVMPTLVLPEVSPLAPEAFGFGAFAALLAMAFAPAYSVAAALGSFFLGAIMGKEKQLARGIAKLERGIQSQVDEARPALVGEIDRSVAPGYERLERYVADRWAVFEKDATDQLSRAGTPLTDAEAAALAQLEAALDSARGRLADVAEEIRWTPAAP